MILLAQIYPYLLIKKQQADIAFKFGETFTQHSLTGTTWHGGRKLKKSVIQKRIELKEKLQSLTLIANYKGKSHVN